MFRHLINRIGILQHLFQMTDNLFLFIDLHKP